MSSFLATHRLLTRCSSVHRRCLMSSTIRRRRKTMPSQNVIRQSSQTTAGAEEEGVDLITVSNEVRMKNAGLAFVLVAFCVGVAGYSMNAVGQAGTGGEDDPLAGLRQEAEAAREKHAREEQSSSDTSDMLSKFQAGQFDPDKYEEEDDDVEDKPRKKRAWWKFW